MTEIEFSRLRSLTARQLISALMRDGFVVEHQSGSHQQYRHEDGRRVTLSFHHPSDTFPPKTLRDIIAQAQWNLEDLKHLKITK